MLFWDKVLLYRMIFYHDILAFISINAPRDTKKIDKL